VFQKDKQILPKDLLVDLEKGDRTMEWLKVSQKKPSNAHHTNVSQSIMLNAQQTVSGGMPVFGSFIM
jgi:hypothetical protein